MPSVQSLNVDRLLTNFSKQWRNDEFVGTQLLPWKQVDDVSGYYDIYTKTDVFEIIEDQAGWDDEAAEIDWSVTTGTFSCLPKALKSYLSYYKLKRSRDPGKLRMRTTGKVKNQILRNLEYKIATLLTTTATYGAQTVTLAGADQWDGATAAADPVADIDLAIRTVALRANVGLTAQPVWDILKRDVTLSESVKYVNKGIVTPDLVAQYFELDKFVIGKAQYSNAAGTMAYMWGQSTILAHVEDPNEESLQLGAVFSPDAEEEVRTWYEPGRGRGSEAVEVNVAYDIKITAAECGYLIYDCIV